MAVATALTVVAVLLLVAALVARGRGLPGRAATEVPRALGLAAVGAGIAAVVFFLVVEDRTLATADGPVLGWLVEHRDPGLTTTAELVSLLGGTVGTGGLAVLSALLLAARGRWERAIVWVVAVIVGSLTIRGLKGAVERPRPPVDTRLAVETSTSLPSGHSLMAALGVGLTVVAVLRLLPASAGVGRRRSVVRYAVVLVGALLVALIGLSRAYLGVHWTTDVVAGWSIGGALLCLAVAVATTLEERRTEILPSEGVPRSPAR